ncbi:MAG: hypothetical protein ACOC29_02795, partial [Candidatus Sumerlaeota bacterium]
WGTPYVKDGVVYAIDQKTGVALKLPSEAGDSLELEVLWKNRGHKDRVYASTIEVDGILYAMGGHGSKLLIAMDAKTGETIYEQKMDFDHRQSYSSIVLAGEHLLISSESGQCAIVKPGRSFELVRMNDLGEGYRTTPIIEHDRIFIRAFKHMFCIGK